MGVQLSETKKKVMKDHLKETAKSVLTTSEKEAVDELVTITAELQKFSAKIKRAEELKKLLASVAASDRFDKEQAAVLRGDLGVVEFSAPGNSREITDKNGLIGVLREKLGYEGLVKEVLKIGLGDADKYLTEVERKPFITVGKGPRSVKSIRLKD